MQSLIEPTRNHAAVTAPTRVRMLYLDVLSILACFGIVVTHCNQGVWAMFGNPHWGIRVLLDTIFYWAVPVFFMVTGATLMDYREKYSTKEYLLKRLFKTVIPFLIWSLIGLAIKIINGEVAIGSLSFVRVINMILNCDINMVYWFFIPLFAIYLAIPIISLIPKDKRIWAFLAASGVSLLTYSILPLAANALGVSQVNPMCDFRSPICAPYMMYVLLGYVLSQANIRRPLRLKIYALGFLGFALRTYTLLVWSVRDGVVNHTFSGYAGFVNAFLAIAVFVLFRSIPWERLFSTLHRQAGLSIVAGTNFGIYLIHYYLCTYLPKLLTVNTNSLYWVVGGSVLIYFISFSLVRLYKRVRKLCTVVLHTGSTNIR